MNLHNSEVMRQFNVLLSALLVARDEVKVTIGEHLKSDYEYEEDFQSVQDGLQADVEHIEEAIEIATDWAIKLDQSISTSNF